MTIPKWAYACPRHRDGLHTWSRTGQNEEVACNHCKLTLTKAESVDLGFAPCRHYWKPVYTDLKPIPSIEPIEPVKLKAVCIHCGARY